MALAPLPPARLCPVTAYLAGLGSAASRERMLFALRKGAEVLTGARCDPRRVPWARVSLAHVLALRQRLQEETGLSDCNLVLCGVRGVLRAAVALGVATEQSTAALTVRSVRGVVETPGRWVPAEEVAALLRAWGGSSARDVRNRFVVALLYYSGARGGELVASEREDVREGPALLLRGKGRKERLVPLAPAALPYLRDYLQVRGDLPGPLLWAVRRNVELEPATRIQRGTLARIVRVGAERAELPETHPHDLRRTFVSELLERGVDLARVQALVGHADPQTTSRYDRRAFLRASEAVAQLPVLHWREEE